MTLQQIAAEFNAKCPVGCRVSFLTEAMQGIRRVQTRTTTAAFIEGYNVWVHVESRAGKVFVGNIRIESVTE